MFRLTSSSLLSILLGVRFMTFLLISLSGIREIFMLLRWPDYSNLLILGNSMCGGVKGGGKPKFDCYYNA